MAVLERTSKGERMRRLALAITAVAIAGCGDLQHESPYDPKTPADQQARTTLAGAVSLEAVGGVTPGLAGVQVSVAGQSYAATTDADGRYAIAGVPPGTYTVQAVLANYQTASVSGITATLDSGGKTVTVPPVALRRVRATLAGAVALKLPNDTLEATGGARVSLASGAGAATLAAGAAAAAPGSTSTALTDGDGAFVIPDVPAPLGSYTLTASKLGYVTQTSTVTFQDGAFVVQTIQLVIDPGAIVGAVAVRGAPDSFGVTVRARGSTLGGTPWEDVTTTDAAGSYRMSGLPAGTYSVSFERADLLTSSTTPRAVLPGLDTTLEPVDLAPATGAIQGIVQLAGAASAAGVVVTAAGPGGGSTVTDAGGAFTLPGLPVGSYTVTARRDPDWQPVTVTGVAVARDQATALPGSPVTLQPVATASIAGTALLEGATDHSGTTVTLTGTDFRGVAIATATTPTAADGSWSFGSLRAGSYQVALAHADYDPPATVGASVVTAQAATFGSVVLAASRGGVGGVATATGAASRAGTVVEISGGPDTATAITDTAGGWRVTGLRVGTGYTATYRRTGYATPPSSTFAVTAGMTADAGSVALQVSRTASISGVATVVRPAGATASAGIHVALRGTDLNGAVVTASTDTVDGGAYTLATLPQGTYALTFTKTAYDAQTQPGIAVADGASATAQPVALAVSTGTIAGQIELASSPGFSSGSDYSGATVSLTGLEADVVVPVAITDRAGSFRFEGVPVHTSGAAYGVVAQRSSYVAGNGSVTAQAGSSVPVLPTPITLQVAVGSVSGIIAVNDSGPMATPPSGTVTFSLTGTAFNSTAFYASADNTNGTFLLPSVPPGTYQLLPTSTGRACGDPLTLTVEPGQAIVLSIPFVCTDAVPPGAVALGIPQGAGAQPGFTRSTAVDVPVVVHALDPSGNVSAYQHVAGAVADWSAAQLAPGMVSSVAFAAGTLTSDGSWTLWVRAVDRVGNAGPPSSVSVVRDTLDPVSDVTILTARTVVDATSTSAIISGGYDVNFHTYQACTAFVDATAACGAPCPLVDTPPSIAVTFDAPNRKACVWAHAVDKAGNTSATVRAEIVSDLVAPTGPSIAPLYDPATVTVHADYVDFRITGAAKDLPGTGADWRGIAWVEADTGAGFTPICSQAACRASGSYDPCSCGCTDSRLVCNGGTFAAIRMPLNGGTANRIAVRAVDLAGNVGSGASQEVRTADVLSYPATSVVSENAPRVRGRTLAYRNGDGATIVDLGSNLRWDATDASCYVPGLQNYEFSVALVDSSTLVYSTGTEVRVRRPGASWCSGFTEYLAGTRSGATWTIHAVTGTVDPATGRLERIAWGESDMSATPRRTRVWVREGTTGAGGSGRIDATALPAVMLYDMAGMTTRVVMGGDVLITRTNTYGTYVQFIDGTYEVLHRPLLGWGTDVPAAFTPPSAIAASVDATGAQLAWVANDPSQTLHVARPGPGGVYSLADPSLLASTTYAASGTVDVTIEGGHAVVAEWNPTGSGHLTHWTAGPDGEFGTRDDAFAQILPSSATRALPALGDGLAGGVVYFGQSSGNNYDLLAADLSAMRWDALTNKNGSYPTSNRSGTYFYGTASGVVARAPDGLETLAPVGSSVSFYAADGSLFAAHHGSNIVIYEPDAEGRFFSTGALNHEVVIPNTAGYGHLGASVAIGVGDGRVVAGTCEADSGGVCSDHSVTLAEPDPIPSTALAFRIDRPADGAPATSYVFSTDGTGVSRYHVAYGCYATGVSRGVCIREPGPNGKYEPAGTLDSDDVSFLLHLPGTTTPYQNAYAVKVDGHRVAFFQGGNVIVVEAGPTGSLDSGQRATTVGAASTTTSSFLSLAGNYVAWLTAGATGGLEPWVGDVRSGTSRQLAAHYSSKYGITAERTGRVLWEDQIFSTRSIFVAAP